MAASNAYLSIMVSASTAAAAEASSSSANECGFFFLALELAEPSGIMCAGKMLHAFDVP